MNNRAYEVIEYLYSEGDIDIILFGYIIGLISCDENEIFYEKTPYQRVSDALKVVEFLTLSGDFEVGKTHADEEGKFHYCAIKEFDDFKKIVKFSFERGGIDDIDLITETWLRKINKEKKSIIIPKYVDDIFC